MYAQAPRNHNRGPRRNPWGLAQRKAINDRDSRKRESEPAFGAKDVESQEMEKAETYLRWAKERPKEDGR